MEQHRILVVDGDVTLTEKITDKLIAKGYVVKFAHSGDEALEILEEYWIDIIIMEINLSGEMKGYELFKQIKNIKKISEIPVIVNTRKPGMKSVFLNLGAEDYIVKPSSVPILTKKIKKILKAK